MRKTSPRMITCNRCMSVLDIDSDAAGVAAASITCPKCGCVNRLTKADRLLVAGVWLALVTVLAGAAFASLSLLKSPAAQRHPEPVPPAAVMPVDPHPRVPPAAAAAPVPQTNAAVAETEKPIPTKTAQAWKTFESYKDCVIRKDYDQATNLLAVINAGLPTAVDRQAFGDKVTQRCGNLVTLKLFYLCAACDGVGIRPPEGGEIACGKCKGTKLCVKCQGVDSRLSKRCRECEGMTCRPCSGAGLCRSCMGYKTVACPKCRGVGNVREVSRASCPSCGGRGFKEGLRRSGGGSSPMRCTRCGGAGTVETGTLKDCVNCAGKGRIACVACAGIGRCAVCGGDGKRKAKCAACENTGVVTLVCPACSGSGRCEACDGSGRRQSREPLAECKRCRATGIARHMELPVDAAWLALSGGCWYDAGKGARMQRVTADSAGTLWINGKKIKATVNLGSNDLVVFVAPR